MRVLTRFVLGAADARQFPAPALPEIAFLGRSNVGKSSVINSLVGSKVARTSSTPGRTRTINFFEIRFPGKPAPELVFADLPGYGYAKLSRELTAQWSEFVDPYLKERPTLVLCVAVVDSNIPPQASDLQLAEFLRAHQRRFLVVATKADRLSGNERTAALRRLREAFHTDDILPYSARTGAGREELWRKIREAAGDF